MWTTNLSVDLNTTNVRNARAIRRPGDSQYRRYWQQNDHDSTSGAAFYLPVCPLPLPFPKRLAFNPGRAFVFGLIPFRLSFLRSFRVANVICPLFLLRRHCCCHLLFRSSLFSSKLLNAYEDSLDTYHDFLLLVFSFSLRFTAFFKTRLVIFIFMPSIRASAFPTFPAPASVFASLPASQRASPSAQPVALTPAWDWRMSSDAELFCWMRTRRRQQRMSRW